MTRPRAIAALLVAAAWPLVARAAPPAGKPAPKPAARAPGRPPATPAHPAAPARPPAAPLPMLPSVARVAVRVSRAQVVLVEEVVLPRGEWTHGALDLWVSFGAPSVPRAIDAHLVSLGDGSLAPEDDEAGEVAPTSLAPRRPAWANPLLGRDAMAGVTVHLEEAALRRAFDPAGVAALRLRSVLDVPEEDPTGGRGVLARLGASRGTPLTLGRVTLAVAADAGKLARAEARLCGEGADDRPLAVGTTPRLPKTETAPVAPVLAVRHAAEDLCVHWWLGP